ncbi:hypothetical protein WN51_11376 [Melipona quadrifasciata]|uniref:Uncharacterized protein n=1 Tax=Melipona quadrifasciata TaxID=166423 RepID=A0A0M9AAE5_9HYME|nr:hypothetical protein WN51_11376 [Melipona quadrifasciata]
MSGGSPIKGNYLYDGGQVTEVLKDAVGRTDGFRYGKEAIVLRFVSESLPRLISGAADRSDSLSQTLVVVTKPIRLVRTHPSGVPHTLLLNVEDR